MEIGDCLANINAVNTPLRRIGDANAEVLRSLYRGQSVGVMWTEGIWAHVFVDNLIPARTEGSVPILSIDLSDDFDCDRFRDSQ